MKATITLLISTYNWKEALQLCLQSILVQTRLPDEIVIADDGSREDTKEVIDQFREQISVPVIHVWQEDHGFRKTIIMNKAVAQAHGDYLIQIDGDVILERHFIKDHVEMMEEGYYVCGSRTKIGPIVTNKLLTDTNLRLKLSQLKLSFVLNGIRSAVLRRFLSKRYARKIDHMRGCNFACWRSDFIKVNGYNENLLEWGHEDGELVYRLHFAGVEKKVLKMGGIVYHLWHKESSRHNEQAHFKALEEVKSGKLKWCNNGIDKYLKNNG